LLGPALLATTVYVVEPPGVSVAAPSVLVTARSACGVSVSVSVNELFVGTGSVTPPVTVAVFESEPIAAGEMEQLAVYVTLPPVGRLMKSKMFPVPDAVHVPPPAPTHVHEHVSASEAPGDGSGPVFKAVIV
jgi:hypothetical protein